MPISRNHNELSKVLPRSLVSEFFSERAKFYGTNENAHRINRTRANGFKEGLSNIEDRILGPLQARFTGSAKEQDRYGQKITSIRAAKAYFFTPYNDFSDFGWGLLAGPGALVGSVFLPHMTMTLLMLPAIGEFVVGVYSLAKAASFAVRAASLGLPDDKQQFFKYLRDGLTRLALSPCLALLCVIQVPIELARFVTRSFVTLVDIMKKCVAVMAASAEESKYNNETQYNNQIRM